MRCVRAPIVKQASIDAKVRIAGNRAGDQALTLNEKLIRSLIVAQTNARDEAVKRIAVMVHDESSQLLAAVYIAVDELSNALAPAERQRCEGIKKLLGQIEGHLRNLSHELHPAMLDHLGLPPSLKALSQQVAQRSGILVTIKEALNGRLAPRLELAIYRVVQEALNNLTRHSQAKNADVRLCDDEGVVQCTVQDDGIGFDPKVILRRSKNGRPGLGLAIARERIESMGSILQVHTAPGAGTRSNIVIPKEGVDG